MSAGTGNSSFKSLCTRCTTRKMASDFCQDHYRQIDN